MNRRQRRLAARNDQPGRAADFLAAAQRHHVGGRLLEAAAGYKKTLRIDPKNIDALTGLGFLMQSRNDGAAAKRLLQKAIKIDPKASKAHYALGVMHADNADYGAAIDAFERSLRLDPDNVECHLQLGLSLHATGEVDRAIAEFRQSLRLDPNYQSAHSNLLFALNYSSGFTPQGVFEEHVRWGQFATACQGVRASTHRFDTDIGPRRLRIGYVSPDFRQHSVAYFLEPLLANHDRTAVEVFCYAEVSKPDEATARFRSLADHWYSTVGVPDEALVQRIRADAIDILIDLAGHTNRNRLPVFAWRPAPVQVTWLGYPNTTGLPTVDFRITDAISDPVGVAETFASETLVRLPSGFLCYRPDANSPDVVDPPSVTRNHVTFGSFNNLAKMSGETTALWADLLQRVPASRILLKSKGLIDERTCKRVRAAFEVHGVDSQRLDLVGWSTSTARHLDLYSDIDIALDTFPYNGTTTTCEALWMGVPVITMAGDCHAARVGASILDQVDATDLIATDKAGFTNIACELAGARNRLTTLRRTLRGKMQASPLMDEKGFARRMEALFRTMIDMKRRRSDAD